MRTDLPRPLATFLHIVFAAGVLFSAQAFAHSGTHAPAARVADAAAPALERDPGRSVELRTSVDIVPATPAPHIVSGEGCPPGSGHACGCAIVVGTASELPRIAAAPFTIFAVPSRSPDGAFAIGPAPSPCTALVVASTHGSRAPPRPR